MNHLLLAFVLWLMAVVPPVFAANIGGGGAGSSGTESSTAEDTAHVGGETVLRLGCHRQDSPASSAGTDGDWATLPCDANGALRVRIDSTAVGSTSADDDGNVAAGTTGMTEALTRTYRYNGTDWSRDYADPCQRGAKTFVNIDITTATTTELTAALAGASTNYYVCSLHLVTAAANNVALVDDDTDNCASVTSGMAGGLTAAEGWNFAANGGIVIGNGQSSVFKTNGANRVLCLVTSAATQLSGNVSYVAAP